MIVALAVAAWRAWEWPFAVLVYEPLHGYMETGLMEGLKQRAERRPTQQGVEAG